MTDEPVDDDATISDDDGDPAETDETNETDEATESTSSDEAAVPEDLSMAEAIADADIGPEDESLPGEATSPGVMPINAPPPELTTRLQAGGASDVGVVRTVNQDSYLISPPIYVVADGMGGHQGGEVASRLAIEAIGEHFDEPRLDELVGAVHLANASVYGQSLEDPGLSGMGTTLVALTLVYEDGEERIAIANVGDSRAYLLKSGELLQITDDHSLVAELVREGRLTEADAEVHPQRNILTRALGIDESVRVDDFQTIPFAGDRYLLCSDGLFNEVGEKDIEHVLRTVDDPDEAAADLVQRARAGGGRDNITVLIVDVLDDGGRAAAASDAVDLAAQSRLIDDEPFGDDTESDGGAPDTAAMPAIAPDELKPQRAITFRSVGFVLLVLALLASGLGVVGFYARNTFVVTDADDKVTINKGRDFLWFHPTQVETSDLNVSDLPQADQLEIEEGRSFSSLESARAYVTRLEEENADFVAPISSTTTLAPTTTEPPPDDSSTTTTTVETTTTTAA